MPIYRLFKDKAFEPEAISAMTRTYAEVCRMLGLNEGDLTDRAARIGRDKRSTAASPRR